MDFTIIVTRLNELTDFMNKIKTLSKKIFQLPSATDGTKYVAVYNEASQVTEKFNLSNALSVSNNLSSKINTLGTISRVDNTFTFSVGYNWTIDNVTYLNTIEFDFTIAEATAGNYRNDIIVLDTLNNLVKISGVENDTIAQQPPTPPNTLLLCVFNIAGNVINNPNVNTNERQVKKVNGASDYTILQSDTSKYLLIETEFDLVLPLNLTDNSEFIIKNISGTTREVIFDTGIEFKGVPTIENNGVCFLKKIDFDGTNEIYSINQIYQVTLQNALDSMDSGIQILLELSSGRYIELTDGANIFRFSPQLLQLLFGGGQFSVGETGFHFTDFNQTIYFDQGRIRFHNNTTGLGHNLYGQEATQDNEIYLPNDSGILGFSHTLYARTTPTATITGVVSETPMQAIDISTLDLKVGSYFELYDSIERLTRTGTAVLKYYSHDSGNWSVGTPTLIAQYNITVNTGNIPFSRRFTVQSGNILKGYAYDGSALNDIIGTSAIYRTTSFAGKTHIIPTIKPSASGDTAISVATIIKGKK